MTETLSDTTAPSDAELISRVRGGDVAAYGELFRRHKDAATRLSHQLVRGPDSDDLVSEAFAKVLVVLQGGGGPDVAFRAYLLTAVRRLHVDRIRASAKLTTSDDMEAFDPGIPFQDTAVAAFENGAAAQAFASLPERWQMVLWHLEVEGQKPAEVAALLGMSANSVSALAYRAREGLRQAFLTKHLNDTSQTECRWVNEHLGAFIRKGLAKRDSGKVQAHLDECRRCTAMYLELTEVNSNLAALIAPLLLGAAAAGYVAASGTAAAGAGGVLAVLGRVRDAVLANTGVAATGAVAATAIAAVAAGAVLLPHGDKEQVIGADAPVSQGPSAPAAIAPAPVPTTVPSRTASPTPRASATPRVPRVSRASAPAAVPLFTLPPIPAPSLTPPTVAPPTLSAVPEPTPEVTPETPPVAPEPTPPVSPDPPADPTPEPTPDPTPVPAPEPTPDPTPEPPAPVQSDVDISGTTVDDDGVTLRVGGDPLPPWLVVDLLTEPSGVTFAAGGDCEVSDAGTRAVCTVGANAAGAPRSAGLAPGDGWSARLDFVGLAQQPDTRLSVSVSLPEGYEDPDPVNNIVDYTSRVADVSLTASRTVAADASGSYRVAGLLDGVPVDYLQPVVLRVQDGAEFTGSATEGCTVSGEQRRQLVCTRPGPDEIDLQLTAADNTRATDLTLSVDPLTGRRDRDRADNTATVTLERFTPEIDLALDAPTTVAPTTTGDYQLTTTITGVPTDYDGQLTLALTGAATLTDTPTPGCTITTTTVTCPATTGSLTVIVSATENSRPTELILRVAPLAGTTDPVPSNNTARVTLERVIPPVDVRLSSLVRRSVSGSINHVRAQIDGVPAGVPRLELRLSGTGTGPQTDGVRFTNGASGASGEGAVGCDVVAWDLVVCTNVDADADGSFFADMQLLHPAGQPDRTVSVTVTAPAAGEADAQRANNTRDVVVG